ncbi:FecCD family ABC transporter permease [Cellvibrio sp. OA-2007]|uniref:FecCD family ABC transporter permease n=1 Tax=Cellvibrio sp. OA-2007 TaxID=529823 RepID=UPI000AC34340|nr:iron ABC transporter permease [Cellvibrio sp. OA-2007]
MQLKKSFTALTLSLLGAIIAAAVLSLNSGAASIPLLQGFTDIWQGEQSLAATILGQIRLPRLCLAIIVGATLGMAGAAMQGLLRNPLADPGVLGVTSGAALGAVGVLYFGAAAAAWYWLPSAAIAGALLSLLLVYVLAGLHSSMLALILAGVAISSITGALIAVALNFAPSLYAMQEIIFWLMGSLVNRHWDHVHMALPLAVIGWLLMLSRSRFLDALSLGEESTRSLGFNNHRERGILLLGIAISVGACVAVSGSIGFVGLIIPHLLRPLVGYRPGRLMFTSALGGALLLVLADILVRQFDSARELKLGVVTSLLGGPFFLLLILKTRSRWA